MKNKLINLYEKLPVCIQNIAISLYGLKLYHERYGKYFKEQIEICREWGSLSAEKQQEIQNEELKKFVNFAYDQSDFYKELYNGIDLQKINSIHDLGILPIVEKEVLRKNIDSVYTVEKKDAIIGHTGGTTGKSLEFYITKEDMQRRMAVLSYWEEGFGIQLNTRRASFNGRQFVSRSQRKKCFWRYNFFRNQMLYSTFDLTEENLPYYIKSLNKFKPLIINGFVSAIYEVAKYINRNSIVLKFQPVVITTTSETLLPYHREAIEKAFRCKVRNQYASSEGAPFVAECSCGKMHNYITNGVIEDYLTEEGTEMIVTGFCTHGTPLIRYRIGDMWERSDEKCTCGSSYPVVKRIEGRKVGFLTGIDGRKVSLSQLADVIKGLPNSVINIQFVQNSQDKLIVKLVVDRQLYCSKDEKQIINELEYRFGEGMTINLDYVEQIPHEKSGKYSLIKLRKENKE